MADNYLEIRLEDMRSGKLKSALHKRYNVSSKKVWIPDINSVDIESVREMVRKGVRVWFGGGEDTLCASRLARTIGCRYVPRGMNPPEDAEIL